MEYLVLPDIMKLTFWQRPSASELGESPRMVIRAISTCRTLATLLRKSYLRKTTKCVSTSLKTSLISYELCGCVTKSPLQKRLLFLLVRSKSVPIIPALSQRLYLLTELSFHSPFNSLLPILLQNFIVHFILFYHSVVPAFLLLLFMNMNFSLCLNMIIPQLIFSIFYNF